jgi:hypothetical protein
MAALHPEPWLRALITNNNNNNNCQETSSFHGDENSPTGNKVLDNRVLNL